MTEQDQQMLAEVVGQKFGEIAVALLAIVQALKNQPHFDPVSFDKDIEARMSQSREDSITRDILLNILNAERSKSE